MSRVLRLILSGIVALTFVASQAISSAYAGGEFRVNTTLGYEQSYPSVAQLDAGGFVVVWQSFAQPVENNRWGGNGTMLAGH